MKKKKKNDNNNRCWFDNQKCPYGFNIKGFEGARRECGNCCQLPAEIFFSQVEYVYGYSVFIGNKENKAREEGIEEGRRMAKEEAEE